MTCLKNSMRSFWQTIRITAALLFVTLCFVSATAQSVDRAQQLDEIISLQNQIKTTTDPAVLASLKEQLKAKETSFLQPDQIDFTTNAAFLAQPNTGLVRIMPLENFDGVLSVRGGGSYYSFVSQVHDYGYGSDLGLEQNMFKTGFAGADFGFLVSLNNTPIETVSADTAGVLWLAGFKTPVDEPSARQQQRFASQGIQENGFNYINRLPADLGTTYALRSIIYESSDMLITFRATRRDTDGSLILAWKVLKRYATQQLGGGTIATVSAASYAQSNFAPETLAVAFVPDLATPGTIGNVSVSIQDSSGRPFQENAPLLAVTPNQVNYLIPANIVEGYALVTVYAASNRRYRELIRIARVAPGLFTANANGQGVPAAVALRFIGNSQRYESISSLNTSQNKFVPTPIDLGTANEQVFLLLFGTGIRGRSTLDAVSVKIGGVEAAINYAGAQGSNGLDQINVAIPHILAGRGEVDVVLTVDGQVANTVRINIK